MKESHITIRGKMNTNHRRLLPDFRFTRFFFIFLAAVILILASGNAMATVDRIAAASRSGVAAPECKDVNCQFLPVVKSPDPCLVGQTLPDPTNDVTPAYIDVTSLSSSFSSTSLTATFSIRDVPTTLSFNRVGVAQNYLEYGWSVHVDIDNNLATGYPSYPYEGTEMMMSADHFVSQPNSPVSLPIQNGVQANTWIYDANVGGWTYGNPVTLTVNPTANTMRMTGVIPGLNANSRLLFETYDYNPGGSRLHDRSLCSETTTSSQSGTGGQADFHWKLSLNGPLERLFELP